MISFTTPDNPPPQTEAHSVIVPIRIESKKALLDFLKDALPLPDYFGDNWDALEECLNDREVIGAKKLVLIHHDLPLENEPAEQHVYLRVVCEAAEESPDFDVLFSEHYRDKVMKAVA